MVLHSLRFLPFLSTLFVSLSLFFSFSFLVSSAHNLLFSLISMVPEGYHPSIPWLPKRWTRRSFTSHDGLSWSPMVVVRSRRYHGSHLLPGIHRNLPDQTAHLGRISRYPNRLRLFHSSRDASSHHQPTIFNPSHTRDDRRVYAPRASHCQCCFQNDWVYHLCADDQFCWESQAWSLYENPSKGHVLMSGRTASMWVMFVQEWFLDNVEDICLPHQRQGYICPGSNTFFTASVIWGAVGPRRLLSPGAIHSKLLWFMFIGFSAPIPFTPLHIASHFPVTDTSTSLSSLLALVRCPLRRVSTTFLGCSLAFSSILSFVDDTFAGGCGTIIFCQLLWTLV